MTSERRRPGRPRKIKPEQQVGDKVTSNPTKTESLATASAPSKILKVHMWPTFSPEDKGDGGIRRVVEGINSHLPKFGFEFVDTAEEADIIAFHATCPPAYVKRFPEKTFVAICHGLYWDEYQWGNGQVKINSEVMEGIRIADAVATCSEWVANNIRRHTSRDVSVIYHGVDAEDWQALESKGYVLWNKTRPDPICDPTPVFEAAKLMPETRFVTTFGQEKSNITITGKLDFATAKEIIQHAGVYLCTTRETFGIGTLEAMASGVPVVGFNFGGQSEFIEHGVDGWLSPPGDISDLVNGIAWALKNREEIGIAARKKAEQFTWDRACEQYANLFRSAYAIRHNDLPRTSIIVTNYNLGRYLRDCLGSVEHQIDQDWECIVVDDASTEEDGLDIVREFCQRDKRFILIQNPVNTYLAEARNVGIRAAKGRYILPLDADDMLSANAVQDLADTLDSDKTIHVAYGRVLFVEEDGRTKTIYDSKHAPGHSAWPFPFMYEQQIKEMNLLPYSSMYRKEAWRQTGGYRRRCRTAEDADMWVRLSSYGFRPKLVTDADTLIYRNRPGSMSRKEGITEWTRWFSWSKLPSITPAGACTQTQLPVPSLDPIQISVIIPVGPGHDKLVQDAIDSVDSQSFRNWECIVINDTGKSLETELPSWVRLLETEGKTGAAHARNVGIKASKGKLFLPLDADDYLQPDALHFMFETYKKTNAAVYTDFFQTSSNGKEISIHECDDYDPYLTLGKKRTVNGVVREGMMHSVTVLTPKIAWERVGGYDENLPAWEDWDFEIALCNIGICETRVPLPLFTYRKHTGYRREENYASFDKAKEGILRKWGTYFRGEKELAGCSSCGARARNNPSPQLVSSIRQATRPAGDAVLIRYTGEKTGQVPYRGVSKTMYWFAKGDVKYVLQQDAAGILAFPDFQLVQPDNTLDKVTAPVLVANG